MKHSSSDPSDLRRLLAEGEIDLDDARLRKAAEHDGELAAELAQLDEARSWLDRDAQETREILEATRSGEPTEAEDRVRELVLGQQASARLDAPRFGLRPWGVAALMVGLAAAAVVLIWFPREEPNAVRDGGEILLGPTKLELTYPTDEVRAEAFDRFEFAWSGRPQATFRILVYDADSGALLADSSNDPEQPRDGVWRPNDPIEAHSILWRVEVKIDGVWSPPSPPCSSWRVP